MASLMALSMNPGQVAMQGGRGLDLGTRLADHVPAMLAASSYTAVQAGQETILEVAVPSLARNANVRSCSATLLVAGPNPNAYIASVFAPAPTTTGITIAESGAAAKSYSVDVDPPDRPRNVTLRLEGGDVFFRFGDQLSSASYALPDFSANLNAYLDSYQGTLPVVLRFVLTSDAQGRAKVEVASSAIDFTRIQTQTWPNPADDTTRIDRSFDLDFGDVRNVDLLPLPSDGSARHLLTLSADVTGKFGPERSLGGATLEDTTAEFATVGADFGAAQSVRPEIDLECVGVTLALATAASATAYAGIYSDSDGQPDLTRPALGETQLQLEATDGAAQWRYATLPAPVALRRGELAWVVCRGIQGEAQLAVSRASLRLLEGLRVSRGGHLWRTFSHEDPYSARGLIRLVYLPGPENDTAATELVLRSAQSGHVYARLPIDPKAQTLSARVPVDVASGDAVRADILSSGRGALTLTNVIQEYQ